MCLYIKVARGSALDDSGLYLFPTSQRIALSKAPGKVLRPANAVTYLRVRNYHLPLFQLL